MVGDIAARMLTGGTGVRTGAGAHAGIAIRRVGKGQHDKDERCLRPTPDT